MLSYLEDRLAAFFIYLKSIYLFGKADYGDLVNYTNTSNYLKEIKNKKCVVIQRGFYYYNYHPKEEDFDKYRDSLFNREENIKRYDDSFVVLRNIETGEIYLNVQHRDYSLYERKQVIIIKRRFDILALNTELTLNKKENLLCPVCFNKLIVSGQERLETLSEHVCDPNETPSLKDKYICSKNGCVTRLYDCCWNDYGEYYGGIKKIDENKDDYSDNSYHLDHEVFLNGIYDAINSGSRESSVNISGKNLTRNVWMPEDFSIGKYTFKVEIKHKSNYRGEVLGIKRKIQLLKRDGIRSYTHYSFPIFTFYRLLKDFIKFRAGYIKYRQTKLFDTRKEKTYIEEFEPKINDSWPYRIYNKIQIQLCRHEKKRAEDLVKTLERLFKAINDVLDNKPKLTHTYRNGKIFGFLLNPYKITISLDGKIYTETYTCMMSGKLLERVYNLYIEKNLPINLAIEQIDELTDQYRYGLLTLRKIYKSLKLQQV